MKMLFSGLVLLSCLLTMALPIVADEKNDDYEKDASSAEGTPPMVPHRIDDKTSKSCLGCHRDGLNGAPQTPHPERLDCTQCHGQGEIKVKKIDSTQEKKYKKMHKN